LGQLRHAAWAALLITLVSLPARAALFDDDEARRRIADTQIRITNVQKQLEDRLAAIEQQIKNQGVVDLFTQVEQLKGDFAKLRGQIEVLPLRAGAAAEAPARSLHRSRFAPAADRKRTRPERRPQPAVLRPWAPQAAPPAASTPPHGIASVRPQGECRPRWIRHLQRATRVRRRASDQFKAGNYGGCGRRVFKRRDQGQS
jgi:hypothetical protein